MSVPRDGLLVFAFYSHTKNIDVPLAECVVYLIDIRKREGLTKRYF